jgi:hypothetical protein
MTKTISLLPEKAREFATAKHCGQKGKRPGERYIQHVETVAEILKNHGHDQPVVLAGAYPRKHLPVLESASACCAICRTESSGQIGPYSGSFVCQFAADLARI